jgi:hypothetical protein
MRILMLYKISVALFGLQVPGLILQGIALSLVILYYTLPAFKSALSSVEDLKSRMGLGFSAASTSLFGGVIPFLIQKLIIGVQEWRSKRPAKGIDVDSAGQVGAPLEISIALPTRRPSTADEETTTSTRVQLAPIDPERVPEEAVVQLQNVHPTPHPAHHAVTIHHDAATMRPATPTSSSSSGGSSESSTTSSASTARAPSPSPTPSPTAAGGAGASGAGSLSVSLLPSPARDYGGVDIVIATPGASPATAAVHPSWPVEGTAAASAPTRGAGFLFAMAELAFLAAFWAYKGIEVDNFYKLQVLAWGSETTPATIAGKTFLDQFVYIPVWACWTCVAAFMLRDLRFDLKKWWGKLASVEFWLITIPTNLLSNWAVWIPACIMIYCLPTTLQLHLFNLVLCFNVLVMSVMARQSSSDLA